MTSKRYCGIARPRQNWVTTIAQGATVLVTLSFCCLSPAMAETHGYVISWFATATYNLNPQESCPNNRNGGRTEEYTRELRAIGYSEQQASAIMATQGGVLDPKYQRRYYMRGRVNGKPVSIYNYPESVPDPNIQTVTGKYAYGFDLGGNPSSKFEDPDTHEKIDNQLWRAVGCSHSFDTVPPAQPYFEDLTWALMVDTAPGWSMQISGDDLSKDGKVTVTLDLLTQHLKRDAAGNVLAGATYVIDPRLRSHSVLEGQINNGILTITKPGNIYLEGEMPFYSEIALRDTHMRVSIKPSGTLAGYWGGYLDWSRFVYMYTARADINGEDVVGLYWALKKMADSDPDPNSGQNRYISATWRMEALPAYLANSDGKIVAVPVNVPDNVNAAAAAAANK